MTHQGSPRENPSFILENQKERLRICFIKIIDTGESAGEEALVLPSSTVEEWCSASASRQIRWRCLHRSIPQVGLPPIPEHLFFPSPLSPLPILCVIGKLKVAQK